MWATLSGNNELLKVGMKQSLKKRLDALELTHRGVGCHCRFRGETLFHNAADLERILAIRCPVHDFCDLGQISWVPPSMPLRMEDTALCSCPPCPTREWLEGVRGPLTWKEQRDECLSWKTTCWEQGGDAEERARVELLLKSYNDRKEFQK